MNQVADALSRRRALVTHMQAKVVGFENVKLLYEGDPDFGSIWEATNEAVLSARRYSLQGELVLCAAKFTPGGHHSRST